MPESLNEQTLRPKFKVSRDEIAKAVEAATGQKPKDGFHSVTMTMQMDGEAGKIEWVDAANRVTSQAKQTKTIPRVEKGKSGNNPANG